MSLQSLAQDQLLVVDPSAIMPLEVSLPLEEGDMGGHHHADMGGLEHEPSSEMHGTPELEVSEPVDIEIVVDELPGAPHGTKDPEPLLEVSEEPLTTEEKPTGDDANDAKKLKNEKWDWSARGPHGFVAWVKEKIDSVPKHSGYDSAGLERAMAYMEKLDNEISRAMRMDLDGELDANKVEEVRAKLDDGIARLQTRLDKVKETKKSSRKRKKTSDVQSEGMVKEAQKILGVSGVVIMAPLLISGIARICINGTVSAGHDIADLYQRQVKQWKLTDREQFELRQLLFDMGFPMPYDRSVLANEDFDPASEDNYELMPNYKG
jgi:hypothetical protein